MSAALREFAGEAFEARTHDNAPVRRETANLLGVQRSREYQELGFDTFESDGCDSLGIAPRTARCRIWLEKRMEELPGLRDALGVAMDAIAVAGVSLNPGEGLARVV